MVYAFSSQNIDFREFFAVKALPNPHILSNMRDMGFGFDCSSPVELKLGRGAGANGCDIMFSSNNTTQAEFEAALAEGGSIINLDDISLLDKLPRTPEHICFRYNPGRGRQADSSSVVGRPQESKFGIDHHQILEGYRLAATLGVEHFGLHTMHTTNVLDFRIKAESARLLLDLARQIGTDLGIRFDFINLGGGIGIPYRPEEKSLDMPALAKSLAGLLPQFKTENGYAPHQVFMESGRYLTGPHGVLVTQVTNVKHSYRKFVGVDACMSSLMRPGMYGAYHHINVLGKDGDAGLVDVVGSLCENNDKFAIQRSLPEVNEGDILIIHDTGAHGQAMGFNYNGRLRPQELLLRMDGSVDLIRRQETIRDYLATLSFQPDTFLPR